MTLNGSHIAQTPHRGSTTRRRASALLCPSSLAHQRGPLLPHGDPFRQPCQVGTRGDAQGGLERALRPDPVPLVAGGRAGRQPRLLGAARRMTPCGPPARPPRRRSSTAAAIRHASRIRTGSSFELRLPDSTAAAAATTIHTHVLTMSATADTGTATSRDRLDTGLVRVSAPGSNLVYSPSARSRDGD